MYPRDSRCDCGSCNQLRMKQSGTRTSISYLNRIIQMRASRVLADGMPRIEWPFLRGENARLARYVFPKFIPLAEEHSQSPPEGRDPRFPLPWIGDLAAEPAASDRRRYLSASGRIWRGTPPFGGPSFLLSFKAIWRREEKLLRPSEITNEIRKRRNRQ
jgi:hypothetical protein